MTSWYVFLRLTMIKSWLKNSSWQFVGSWRPQRIGGSNANKKSSYIQSEGNYPRWFMYKIILTVLVKVHLFQQLRHGILVTLFPFLQHICWWGQFPSLCLRCAHSIDTSFGSSSQVELQGQETGVPGALGLRSPELYEHLLMYHDTHKYPKIGYA